jgi:hypothetical protein
MRLISARELKEKLDRSDPLKLVNALGDWEYRAAHIPGSLHFSTPEETLRELGRDDEIIVQCSNPSCMASVALSRHAGDSWLGMRLRPGWSRTQSHVRGLKAAHAVGPEQLHGAGDLAGEDVDRPLDSAFPAGHQAI